jgi:hypothetical protein
MMRRLRQDKRGINNVITAMLGLIIVVIIVANVFIWNYEMNAIDLEKSQEQVSIESVVRGDSASYNPTGYSLLQGTRLVSGSTNNLGSDDSIYMTTRSFASATSTVNKTDAFIAYRSNSGTDQLNSPKSRVWSGDNGAWSAENEMPNVGSSVLFTRVAYCPVQQRSFEKIVVTLSDDGYLNAYVYDGTSWVTTSDVGQVWMIPPALATRPYDVAYESTSGEALLLYETVVGGGTKDLAYRTWSLRTGWSQERYFDDSDHPSKIAVSYVELTSVPNSDKIGVAYIDSTNSHANAMVWNGNAFSDFVELTGSISISSEECVSIASETKGAIVAVAGEGEFIKWSRFTTSWSPVAVFDINSGATNAMNWLKLAQSQDDRLMLTSVDSATDLATSVLDENSAGNRQWETATESMGSMTTTGSVSAIRFTAQANESVTNVLMFIQTALASPAYRFGIETSTAGYLPNGTYVGGASNYAVATPVASGWLNLTLPSPAALTAGTVYHITVRYDSGTIGASNYIALRRLGTNQNNYRPRENAIDSWLNPIFGNGVQNRDPIFVLKYNETDSYEAMPYDNVAANNVYGANWYSERWTQNGSNTIVGVNIPLVNTGTPPDSLYIVLRSETDSQDVATITVPQNDITTTLQWYERYFNSPVSLLSGKSYSLILKSPSSTSSNYFTIRSLTTSQSGDLTYDGTNSYYSMSSNSGASWTDTLTQDLTYILLLQNAGTMGWVVHPPWDAAVDTHASRCADFAWEYRASPTFENEGLLVYGTTAGQITWRKFRAPNFMAAATSVAMGTNIHAWVQLKSNPRTIGSDTIVLGAVLESTTYNLGAIKWDGTTFTVIGTSTLAVDTTVATYECFDIEFAYFGDPVEFTTQVEFTGTSDLGNWTSLTWSIDSAWSAGNVTVALQLFAYNLGAYPASGDGYISYNSSSIPYTDEIKNQTIMTNPTRFRDGLGQWKIKITGVKSSSTQLDMEADMIELRLPASGPSFLFRNSGTVTSHIVSLWAINSSVHQRYDVSVYLNSGEDVVFHRDDISIPSGQYTVRIVTDKGNLATFSGS